MLSLFYSHYNFAIQIHFEILKQKLISFNAQDIEAFSWTHEEALKFFKNVK